MTQYNFLNVKLSNSQLKSKSGIKTNNEVTEVKFHQMLLGILMII